MKGFEMTLSEFAQGKTQPQLAEMLGVSQGAVSQMLNSTRDIRVESDGQGGHEFIEIRRIGRKHKGRKSKDH